MSEWLIEQPWKGCVGLVPTAGSNPALSGFHIAGCRRFCPYLYHHLDFGLTNPQSCGLVPIKRIGNEFFGPKKIRCRDKIAFFSLIVGRKEMS